MHLMKNINFFQLGKTVLYKFLLMKIYLAFKLKLDDLIFLIDK